MGPDVENYSNSGVGKTTAAPRRLESVGGILVEPSGPDTPYTWADEPPTEAGFHFRYDKEERQVLVVDVIVIGEHETVVCLTPGVNHHILTEDLVGYEWSGPIPMPKDTQTKAVNQT
jgi:hypothetical protein